jgi:hypothetical protein
MDLNGRVRKRFLEIFFTKKVNDLKLYSETQQVAVRPLPLIPYPQAAVAAARSTQDSASAFASALFSAGCLFLALLTGACATTKNRNSQESAQPDRKTVYVVHHGSLHTGLTVKRSDIPSGIWPAHKHYGSSKYIEVGWGDDDGYRKPLTAAIALKALGGSKRTVLLVDGFNQSVNAKYSDHKFTVLAVDLEPAGFARLCQHVHRTHALDRDGRPIPLGGGWFRARGTYSAFNTCNTWIAAALRDAGCPISPAFCSLPKQLLGRVRPFARPVR